MLNKPFPMSRKYINCTVPVVAILVCMLLTACPGNKMSKESNSTSFTNIDSASLIHHLEYLSSSVMEGRETGSHGNQLAREYIVSVFDSLRLEKLNGTYLQPFPLGDSSLQGTNIMGFIKGGKYPDSLIVITAHYDHLGTRNGVIYYGADDNASGTAALLTMAQYFKQHIPRHSILFIAFDAEEKGLLGSKYFVANSPVPITSMTINLNMDMVSRNDNNEIYASGIYHYPFLKKYVDSIQAFTHVHILFGHDDPAKGGSQDWTSQSDHFAFHQRQIPFLYFGVEDHADYHQPGDTFDKVNKRFYFQVCNTITAVALLIDRQAALR
jgi:Zn-dependent M28 family amino/carboxypeptidase